MDSKYSIICWVLEQAFHIQPLTENKFVVSDIITKYQFISILVLLLIFFSLWGLAASEGPSVEYCGLEFIFFQNKMSVFIDNWTELNSLSK